MRMPGHDFRGPAPRLTRPRSTPELKPRFALNWPPESGHQRAAVHHLADRSIPPAKGFTKLATKVLCEVRDALGAPVPPRPEVVSARANARPSRSIRIRVQSAPR
jgi:hypothetical protein